MVFDEDSGGSSGSKSRPLVPGSKEKSTVEDASKISERIEESKRAIKVLPLDYVVHRWHPRSDSWKTLNSKSSEEGTKIPSGSKFNDTLTIKSIRANDKDVQKAVGQTWRWWKGVMSKFGDKDDSDSENHS